jgi:TRAP-type C4-dicarboxylate transport system substrate-binding protein
MGCFCLLFILTLIPVHGAYAADPVVQLKFANYFPPPAPQSKICEDFIAALEKRTGGTVKVQFFAG